jgi:hypothetical protein
MNRLILAQVAFLAVGALAGWAVATDQLNFSRRALASPEPATSSFAVPTAKPCCKTGINLAELVLIAAHNEQVSANVQKDGK